MKHTSRRKLMIVVGVLAFVLAWGIALSLTFGELLSQRIFGPVLSLPLPIRVLSLILMAALVAGVTGYLAAKASREVEQANALGFWKRSRKANGVSRTALIAAAGDFAYGLSRSLENLDNAGPAQIRGRAHLGEAFLLLMPDDRAGGNGPYFASLVGSPCRVVPIKAAQGSFDAALAQRKKEEPVVRWSWDTLVRETGPVHLNLSYLGIGPGNTSITAALRYKEWQLNLAAQGSLAPTFLFCALSPDSVGEAEEQEENPGPPEENPAPVVVSMVTTKAKVLTTVAGNGSEPQTATFVRPPRSVGPAVHKVVTPRLRLSQRELKVRALAEVAAAVGADGVVCFVSNPDDSVPARLLINETLVWVMDTMSLASIKPLAHEPWKVRDLMGPVICTLTTRISVPSASLINAVSAMEKEALATLWPSVSLAPFQGANKARRLIVLMRGDFEMMTRLDEEVRRIYVPDGVDCVSLGSPTNGGTTEVVLMAELATEEIEAVVPGFTKTPGWQDYVAKVTHHRTK